MEKDIIDGKIGEHGKYDLEFKEGKLTGLVELELSPVAEGAAVEVKVNASAKVSISAEAVIDAIEKAIPGDQTGIAATLKALLLK